MFRQLEVFHTSEKSYAGTGWASKDMRPRYIEHAVPPLALELILILSICIYI